MDDAAKRADRQSTKPEPGVADDFPRTPPVGEIVDAIPLIIWAARPDGSPEYFNERWYQFTGSCRTASNHDWSSFVHADDLQNFLSIYKIPAGHAEPSKATCRLKQLSGSYRWFLIQALPILNQDNHIVRWLGTCTDIHDERTTVLYLQEFLKREKAARANNKAAIRAKDEFLAIVGHELRTPLNAILGRAAILRKSDPTNAGIVQGIESIERNGKIQAQIIDDILDISRTMLGKMSLERCLVNPVETVNAAIDTVRLDADARGLRIELSCSSQQAFVLGDPRRLQQVVWNLLSNAIKFTPEGGLIEVGLEHAGNDLNITVSDTGEGIDSRILPVIFNRFSQADPTRHDGGLGLGLSIVRQLVEMHGGRVSATSAGLGFGSTFTVSLPTLTPNAEMLPAIHTEQQLGQWICPPHLHGRRMLLIDDQLDSLTMLQEFLRRVCRAEIVISLTVADGLKVLHQWKPDIFLSDIALPGEDGYQVIAKIREQESGRKRIPAIALSTLRGGNEQERAIGSGYDDFLTKPVDLTALLEVLGRLLYVRSER
jgi:signal transduction histidine kinase/CheY-like chemotaxis protein